jgi:hypothetical protein
MIIKTSATISEKDKDKLLKAATKILVDAGKPESHVMIILEKVDSSMGGKIEDVAFVEVRSMVGLTPQFNHKISETLCPVIEEILNISGHNIYMNFMSVPVTAWGWDHGIVIWKDEEKKWVIE